MNIWDIRLMTIFKEFMEYADQYMENKSLQEYDRNTRGRMTSVMLETVSTPPLH